MTGHAELAHQKSVERRVQNIGHFGSDRYAAAWQPEHDDIGAVGVGREVGGEAVACIVAVLEGNVHHATPDTEPESAFDSLDPGFPRRACVAGLFLW